MRLSIFETDGKKHYSANVWEINGKHLLFQFYTTKKEAIKAVKAYKKSYKGNKELDCYVRLYDKYGFSIEAYDI